MGNFLLCILFLFESEEFLIKFNIYLSDRRLFFVSTIAHTLNNQKKTEIYYYEFKYLCTFNWISVGFWRIATKIFYFNIVKWYV